MNNALEAQYIGDTSIWGVTVMRQLAYDAVFLDFTIHVCYTIRTDSTGSATP